MQGMQNQWLWLKVLLRKQKGMGAKMSDSAKLYVLTNGRIWTERGFLAHWGTQEDTGKAYYTGSREIRSTSWLIDHPKAKIVFDLGFTIEDFTPLTGFPHRKNDDGIFFIQEPDENPVAQLAKISLTVDDIDYVVISHIMIEHAGWLPAFAGTKAKIIVQQKEWDYATRIGVPPKEGEAPAVEQFHSWMYLRKHFEIPGLNFQYIDGDFDLIGKDVQILSLPGHTPGYQNIVVRLPNTGTVALSACEVGDMYNTIPINGYAPGIPHAVTWWSGGELHSFKRVKDLVESEGGQIFYGHDAEQWNTLKHAPEYYD
jgi:glyoxylase-like metal-dependent hydrolase (beta-lactamase superfamily II)